MTTVDIGGIHIAYDVIGEGRPWVITPGGRYSKDTPGVRQLAEELARHGQRVVIWDRPNTGASDVHFTGAVSPEMQADALANLLRHLELGPTVIVGGSGGARVFTAHCGPPPRRRRRARPSLDQRRRLRPDAARRGVRR